jgi:hypothetical protein
MAIRQMGTNNHIALVSDLDGHARRKAGLSKKPLDISDDAH